MGPRRSRLRSETPRISKSEVMRIKTVRQEMKKQDTSPSIEVYCTVERRDIQETGEEVICTRCRRRLFNPGDSEDASRSGRSRCVFIRALTIPALASAMAVSACKENNQEAMWVGVEKAPAAPDTYPEAAFVDGSLQRVISPYTGDEVDVSGVPAGSLVVDPSSVADDEKFFRIPVVEERTNPVNE